MPHVLEHMFVLDDDPAVPRQAASWDEWAAFQQQPERSRVATDFVREWKVSTIFTSTCVQVLVGYPLMLWETIVIGPDPYGGRMDRWASLAEARVGHANVVRWLEQYTALRR